MRRFGVSEQAVRRHRAKHLAAGLAKAQQAREVARADDLLQQVDELRDRAWSILEQAEAAGDLRMALGAIREARETLQLLARLLGELREGPTVNLLVAPQWVELRTTILRTLEPYAEARVALAAGLAGLDDVGR